jgi:hypothetical protein
MPSPNGRRSFFYDQPRGQSSGIYAHQTLIGVVGWLRDMEFGHAERGAISGRKQDNRPGIRAAGTFKSGGLQAQPYCSNMAIIYLANSQGAIVAFYPRRNTSHPGGVFFARISLRLLPFMQTRRFICHSSGPACAVRIVHLKLPLGKGCAQPDGDTCLFNPAGHSGFSGAGLC